MSWFTLLPWKLRWLLWFGAAVAGFYLVEDFRGALAWMSLLREHPGIGLTKDEFAGGQVSLAALLGTEAGRYRLPHLAAPSRAGRKLSYPLFPFRRAGRWNPSAILGNHGVSERESARRILEKNFPHRSYRTLAALEFGEREEARRGILASFADWDELGDGFALASGPGLREETLQTLQLIWQGIAEGKWEAEDIEAFRQALVGVGYLDRCAEGARRDAGLAAADLRNLRWNPAARVRLAWSWPHQRPGKTAPWFDRLEAEASIWSWRGTLLLMPNGWVDRNAVQLGEGILQGGPLGGDGESGPWHRLAHEIYLRHLPHVDPRPTAAYLRCALVATAAESYRLRTGRHPRSLDDLIPAYLEAVPEDPYARDGGLRYAVDAAGPVIYSIGPNLRDDGGKPRAPISEGDLVWRYALPDGQTYEDYSHF